MDADWTLLNITGGNVPDDIWQSLDIYAGWNRCDKYHFQRYYIQMIV